MNKKEIKRNKENKEERTKNKNRIQHSALDLHEEDNQGYNKRRINKNKRE